MYGREVEVGEFIVRENEPGNHLFVSAEGEFEIIVNDKVLGTLPAGKAFGELAILYNCRRTASIRGKKALMAIHKLGHAWGNLFCLALLLWKANASSFDGSRGVSGDNFWVLNQNFKGIHILRLIFLSFILRLTFLIFFCLIKSDVVNGVKRQTKDLKKVFFLKNIIRSFICTISGFQQKPALFQLFFFLWH